MLYLSQQGVCYLCGSVGYTELHHVFEGSNRKQCDLDGLTVYLCPRCHTGDQGVHSAKGKTERDYLHRTAQKEYERKKVQEGMSKSEAREDFIKHYIRSYL